MFGKKKFEPAVYFGTMPQEYIGKSRLVRPISVSEEFNVPLDHVKCLEDGFKIIEDLGMARLEKKVKELLKDSNAEFVVLENPVVDILSTSREKDPEYVFTIYSRANGKLYKLDVT